jgi:nicotinate-nucleotide--dimethylbenzimidazole phosphoribosyltransferase
MAPLSEALKAVRPQDGSVREAARAHLAKLVMPHWALGRVLDIGIDLAGITGSLKPSMARKTIVIMAGDHGVVAEGVSKYPQEVTPQMVMGFVNGGAGINALARLAGARVVVVDMGVAGDLLGPLAKEGKIISRRMGPGTGNIARGPAMSREQALACVEAGMAIAAELAPTTDVFGTGDMGIGNTTPSAAIAAVVSGKSPAEVTGRGTGIDDAQLARKAETVARALAVNQPDPADGLDVLAKVGGFEIAGLAGLILGAAAAGKPVIIDGYISTAAAIAAKLICPLSAGYMFAAHRSAENGHAIMQAHVGKEPLLDLGMRLGEGTGAALAMNIIEAAARVLSEVATFSEAAVSGPVS